MFVPTALLRGRRNKYGYMLDIEIKCECGESWEYESIWHSNFRDNAEEILAECKFHIMDTGHSYEKNMEARKVKKE